MCRERERDEKETKKKKLTQSTVSQKFEFVSRRDDGELRENSGKRKPKKKTMSSRRRTRCPCSKGVTIFLKNSNHSVEDTHDLLFKLVDNDCAKCMDRVFSQ